MPTPTQNTVAAAIIRSVPPASALSAPTRSMRADRPAEVARRVAPIPGGLS
jgi:hypothetical protein